MSEREAFRLTAQASIVDSIEDAVKILSIQTRLLGATLVRLVELNDMKYDNDILDAMHMVEQGTAALDMYIERSGLWNTSPSQEN